jgi:type I restriction enzyme M protein
VWWCDRAFTKFHFPTLCFFGDKSFIFSKDEPTQNIWYWEHRLPDGVKAYSKTKPFIKSEFRSLCDWWENCEEGEQAWRVSFADLEKNGFNLDVRNPHVVEVERGYSSVELLGMLHDSFKESDDLLDMLKNNYHRSKGNS